MRALSVRQPWADAIAYAGKRVDNRGWATSYRGPLLIHAAKQSTRVAGVPEGLPDARQAVIAIAQLVGCHTCDGSCSKWADPGAYHLELAEVKVLRAPVRCAGRLGLWFPDADVVQRVMAAPIRGSRWSMVPAPRPEGVVVRLPLSGRGTAS